MKWEEKSSEVILEVGLVKLCKSVRINPRNDYQGDYYVFDFADWVTVLPFTPEGNLLVINQFRHGSKQYELEFPGGVIEKGEDVVVAAHRELEEETAGKAEKIEQIAKLRPNPSTQDNWCYVMKADDVRCIGELNFDDGEDIEVIEMTVMEVKEAIADGRMTNAMMVAAVYAAGL